MDMKLRRKIGQMISAGFPSPFVDEQATRLVKELGIGNFFIFARNIESAEQITRLNHALKTLVFEQCGIQPFISIDQEGGAVSRIVDGAALFPGAMALGASGGKYAYECGKNSAEILRAMGFTTTASPVLDVNIEPLNPIIGSRAYSDDPDTVSRIGREMMRGIADGGLIATVKHFPGHGNVKSDSHLTLPVNDTKRETLEDTEWKPFRDAFKAGADSVMSAHVLFTDVDSERPATLSKAFLTDLLRNRMGFCGVAVTDCMEMQAVKALYGSGEAAVMAIEAGCDLMTVSHTYEAAEEVVMAIENAVETGRISEERIDLSVARILALKEKYGFSGAPELSMEKAKALAYDREKIDTHLKAAMDSMTVIGKKDGLALLKNAVRPVFCAPCSFSLNNAEEDKGAPLSFAKTCAKAFGGSAVDLPINEFDENKISEIAEGDSDVIVLGLYNARFRDGQKATLRALEKAQKPLVVVLLGAPYDAGCVKKCDLLVAAYEYTNLSVKAFIECVKAQTFTGVLPVKL